MRIPGRAALLVTAGFLAATMLYVAPIAPRAARDVPQWLEGAFDAPTQAFLLGWGWEVLRRHPGDAFDAPIFHPERRTLAYMDSMLGEAAAASPVLAATGSVAAGYNFLVAISVFLSAWFTYRLARRLGAERPGAFLAGLLFAFSTYRLTNSDFLNQLQTQFLPLGIDFGIRFHQRGRWRHAAGLGATLATQAYFGWYYACILVVALLLLAMHAAFRRVAIVPRGGWVKLAILAPALAILTAPIVIPVLEQRAAMPTFRRTLGQTALYSADLLDYVRASERGLDAARLGLPAGPNALFPGVVLIGLAALGARAARKATAGVLGYLPLLALGAFVLSLGPVLHVAGVRYWVPLPYIAAYYAVPGLWGLRAPFRFAVLVFLAAALLAAIGYRALDRHVASRGPRWRGPLFALAVVASLASAWPATYRFVRLPTAETIEPAYRWLAANDPGAPLLEWPNPATDSDETATHALRQYRVLLHGHPRLDGCSGFVSPLYKSFRPRIQSFPDAAALALADSLGARLVLVHYGDLPADEATLLRARVAAAPALAEAAAFGSDVVYRLEGGAPPPGTP
ncbi:MAG TPA: hypothetical protein VFU59_10500 [Candidatus Eisenbacteria bacterium]|nr:hypothetical protein [Candidatus Eisenbacteria bacterium]